MKNDADENGIYTTPKNVIKIIEGPADIGFLQKTYEFILRCFI